MAKLPKVALVIKNKTRKEWEDYIGILEKGQLGLETDTGKMKSGDGENLYVDLPYLYLNVSEIEEMIGERYNQSDKVTSITIDGEILKDDVQLGKLALLNEISFDNLSGDVFEQFNKNVELVQNNATQVEEKTRIVQELSINVEKNTEIASNSAQEAKLSAQLAEQTAATLGWLYVEGREDGNLYFVKSENAPNDFRLVDDGKGVLMAIYGN